MLVYHTHHELPLVNPPSFVSLESTQLILHGWPTWFKFPSCWTQVDGQWYPPKRVIFPGLLCYVAHVPLAHDLCAELCLCRTFLEKVGTKSYHLHKTPQIGKFFTVKSLNPFLRSLFWTQFTSISNLFEQRAEHFYSKNMFLNENCLFQAGF